MLKNKYVLIFNGSGGVGKTQIQQFIKEIVEGTLIVSTVDKVKEAATLLNWNGTKDEKSRKFLSDLKMLAMEYNDCSYNYIKSKVEYLHTYLYWEILCVDSREVLEIERFKKDFNAKTILVRNPNVPSITSNVGDADACRTDYGYDYYIDNDGTLEDLKVKVREFLEGLEKENDTTIQH